MFKHYFLGKIRTTKQYLNILAEQKKTEKLRKDLDQKSIYSHFITPGSLVFDIGANIGEKTRLFLGLGAKVLGVEPQPSCARLMKKRFKSELNHSLKVVEKGVSNSECFLDFHICDTANTISTFSKKWQTGRFSDYVWNRKKQVQMTTLDKLIEEYGVPVFCKIDVEGYELKVLKGLSQPIKYISFEFTKEFLEDAVKCMNHISTLGDAEFSYGGHLKTQRWLTAEKLVRELKRNHDDHLHGDIYARIS